MKKTKRIYIRVSADDHDAILSRAIETGLTISDYVRQVSVTGGSAVSAAEIQKLVYQVRKIGTNINQCAFTANSAGMDSKNFTEAISHINNFILFLRRVQGK